MGNIRNIIAASVAGLAAGLVIGLLIAPEKGSKTRKRIRRAIDDIGQNLSDEYSGLKEKISDAFSSESTENEMEETPDTPDSKKTVT